MSKLTQSAAWKALSAHHALFEPLHMRQLFLDDPARFQTYSLKLESLLFDFSKNRINEDTIRLLIELAEQADMRNWIERLFDGGEINSTEHRAALHSALRNRSDRPVFVDGRDVMSDVRRVQGQMREFSLAVRSGAHRGYTGKPVTDIVNIGIGGSDLGPQMVCEALKPYARADLNVHFVSNVDGTQLVETLKEQLRAAAAC